MNQLNYLFLLTGLALFFSSNTGCEESKQASVSGVNYEKDIEVEEGKSLLYRIGSKELEQPSYLYGTIHMIAREDYHMGERLEDIASGVDAIVMELKIDDVMGEMMSIMQAATLPEGRTIADYMEEEDFQLFRSYMLDTLKIPVMQFSVYQRLKPIFLSQLFLQQMMGEDMVAFEMEFQKIAEADSIEIIGLETFEQQIGLFDSIPVERQIDLLIESLHSYSEENESFDRMIEFYKNQEIDSLFILINEDSDYTEFMKYSDAFLVERNKDWIPKIESVIREKQVLIAVGAAHLPGEDGVIDLLRKKGYTLTPVSTENSRN